MFCGHKNHTGPLSIGWAETCICNNHLCLSEYLNVPRNRFCCNVTIPYYHHCSTSYYPWFNISQIYLNWKWSDCTIRSLSNIGFSIYAWSAFQLLALLSEALTRSRFLELEEKPTIIATQPSTSHFQNTSQCSFGFSVCRDDYRDSLLNRAFFSHGVYPYALFDEKTTNFERWSSNKPQVSVYAISSTPWSSMWEFFVNRFSSSRSLNEKIAFFLQKVHLSA